MSTTQALAVTNAVSTLSASQTSFPTSLNLTTCDGSVRSPPISKTGCSVQTNNITFNVLRACCNSAPIVLFGASFCNAYCEAKNQTELNSCLWDHFTPLDSDKAMMTFCTGPSNEVSSSSTRMVTSTTTGTVIPATTSPTGAASSLLLEGGRNGVSKAAWAVMAVLAGSFVFGMVM